MVLMPSYPVCWAARVVWLLVTLWLSWWTWEGHRGRGEQECSGAALGTWLSSSVGGSVVCGYVSSHAGAAAMTSGISCVLLTCMHPCCLRSLFSNLPAAPPHVAPHCLSLASSSTLQPQTQTQCSSSRRRSSRSGCVQALAGQPWAVWTCSGCSMVWLWS